MCDATEPPPVPITVRHEGEPFVDWGSSQLVGVPGYGRWSAIVLAVALLLMVGGLGVVIGVVLAHAV